MVSHPRGGLLAGVITRVAGGATRSRELGWARDVQRVRDAAFRAHGEVILAGSTMGQYVTREDAWVGAMREDGSPRWKARLRRDLSLEVHTVTLGRSALVISGIRNPPGSGTHGFAAAFDYDGRELWVRDYGGDTYHFFVAAKALASRRYDGPVPIDVSAAAIGAVWSGRVSVAIFSASP